MPLSRGRPPVRLHGELLRTAAEGKHCRCLLAPTTGFGIIGEMGTELLRELAGSYHIFSVDRGGNTHTVKQFEKCFGSNIVFWGYCR